MAEALHLTSILNAPAGETLRAFTHATALRDWFCNDALAQPRLNGSFSFYWNDGYQATCPVTHFDPPHGLDFDWFSLLTHLTNSCQ